MSLVTLPMYDLPEVRDATDALWRGLARHLRAEGVRDVPDVLDRSKRSQESQWNDPMLLLSQSCGYPVTHAFAAKLRVVVTPSYAVSGCERASYFSVVVVAEASKTTRVVDLRGCVVAVNEPTSHSGTNALGALIAPLTTDAGDPFFAAVEITGSHAGSLAAVARGQAAVAAIDCVTHALLEQVRPSALAGTRVIATTPQAPALPYVTRAEATDDDVRRLRAGLFAAMSDSDLAASRDALLLRSVEVLDPRAYERILELERTHRGRATGLPS